MKLYCIVSTTDGLSVTPYETLDQAVKEWLSGMEECPQKERLSMEYGAKGAQACLDEAKLMDYEDIVYLWRDGEERVEELDIDFAVSKNYHEHEVDRLRDDLEEAKADLEEYGPILEVLRDNRCSFAGCLDAAAEFAAETYGYASDEYWTMTSLSPLRA